MRGAAALRAGALTLAITLCASAAAAGEGLIRGGAQVLLANITSDTDRQGNADGRGTITEKAAELGLTDAEVDWIKGATGYVACPGTLYDNPVVGSAALVGSNMQIITAAHIFIEKSGRKREPLSDCYFAPQNQGTAVTTTYPLDFDSGGFRFGNDASRKVGDIGDWAVVRLKEPVPGAVPFRYDTAEPKRDDWILVVSSFMGDLSADEPLVQECRVRGFQHPESAEVRYITDCDAEGGASGGPVMVRDKRGNLAVIGVVVDTGKQKLDGQKFDPKTGSFTRVVGIGYNFVWAIIHIRDALPRDGVTFAE